MVVASVRERDVTGQTMTVNLGHESHKSCFRLILSSCLILRTFAAATAKSLQSWPTLCDPIDGRPPGSPVPGILQARTLEWVAISFSSA